MKAHTHFSIALLMATCCCFSTFCADTPKKKLNWDARKALEHEYIELDAKEDKGPKDLQRKLEIATQMKERYEQLVQQGPHDKHAQSRKKQAEDWEKKETKSHDELIKWGRQSLNQVSLTANNEIIKNKDLSPTQKTELRKMQHEAVHTLKESYQEESNANPQNKDAEMLAQQFMVQSALLTQIIRLESQQLQRQTPLSIATPQTSDASEPVSTVTTQTSSFAPNRATADRPMAITTVVAPASTVPVTQVNVEIPKENTEKQTDEQKKDKNCIIL